MRTSLRTMATALLAAALVVGACGGDDDDTSAAVTTTVAAESTTTAVAATNVPAETTTTVPPDDGAVFEVSVTGVEVTGGGRKAVALGETVTLRVTTDVADEIHLHGYDVYVDAPEGVPTELTFEATIPGIFEVELENARTQLVEFEIQ